MYVTIRFYAENIHLKQSEYLVGFPSPIAFLSFVENIQIKAGLVNPKESNSNTKVCIGIKSFSSLEMTTQRSSQRTSFKNTNGREYSRLNPGTIKEEPLGCIEASVTFKLNNIGDMDSDEIKKLLNKTILKLRFASGMIIRHQVFVTATKNEALYKMMPTFVMMDYQEEIKDIDELLEKVYLFTDPNYSADDAEENEDDEELNQSQEKGEVENADENNTSIVKTPNVNYEPTIKGYSFISGDQKCGKFETMYAESNIGLVYFKALTKSMFDDIEMWQFKSLENGIVAHTNK